MKTIFTQKKAAAWLADCTWFTSLFDNDEDVEFEIGLSYTQLRDGQRLEAGKKFYPCLIIDGLPIPLIGDSKLEKILLFQIIFNPAPTFWHDEDYVERRRDILMRSIIKKKDLIEHIIDITIEEKIEEKENNIIDVAFKLHQWQQELG
jgi:hypothetical protein